MDCKVIDNKSASIPEVKNAPRVFGADVTLFLRVTMEDTSEKHVYKVCQSTPTSRPLPIKIRRQSKRNNDRETIYFEKLLCPRKRITLHTKATRNEDSDMFENAEQ